MNHPFIKKVTFTPSAQKCPYCEKHTTEYRATLNGARDTAQVYWCISCSRDFTIIGLRK